MRTELLIKIVEKSDKDFALALVPADTLEKFAELIVRECAYIPIDMWDKAELNADVAVKIEDRIKEHFGVQE